VFKIEHEKGQSHSEEMLRLLIIIILIVSFLNRLVEYIKYSKKNITRNHLQLVFVHKTFMSCQCNQLWFYWKHNLSKLFTATKVSELRIITDFFSLFSSSSSSSFYSFFNLSLASIQRRTKMFFS
jgi:hypothetical protein